MALLKLIGFFTFFHDGNWNQQGQCVPVMWRGRVVVVWLPFIWLGRTLKRICYS